MSEHDGVRLRSIHWSEVSPWLSLLRCFRLAVTLRALVLGAVAILLTLVGWSFFAWSFSADEQAVQWWTNQFGESSPWMVIDHAVPSRPFLPFVPTSGAAPRAVTVYVAPPEPEIWRATDPFFGTWARLSRPVWEIFVQPTMTPAAMACLVLSALWSLAVWGFFGAAITRIVAVQLASDEIVGWAAAVRWASSKWLAYFGAPLFPLLGVLLAVIPLLLLGFVARLDIGLLLVGLLWPLLLIGGLVMTLLLLGLVFGWPLMWATISAEGTDSFDALSRTYAYVFQRPLRYLFYAIVAAILGWLGWLLVENLAAGIVWLTYWAAGWGSGAQRMGDIVTGNLEGIGYAGSACIWFWAGCVKWLALGYLVSYFWTASTAIYFLLRRDVDATELDEVFLDADESEPGQGLPPLTTDEAGAPEVADTPKPAGNGGPNTAEKPPAGH